jgi:murein DD-endopeptidase MepM/ murein hydrolase activator NlpD
MQLFLFLQRLLRPSWARRWTARGLSGLALAGVTIALIAWPARAILQVQVAPTSPRLGDTITILTQTENPPNIVSGGKAYPAFSLGNNRFRTLIPTTPLNQPGTVSIDLQAGADRQTLSLNLLNRSFPTQRIWLPPGQDGNVSDWEYDRVDAFKQTVTPQKFWNGPFLRPNDGEVTTGYGVRRYYNGEFAADYFHRGVDYAGDPGSAVIAPAAGRVVLIGRESEGFKVHGNCVGLDHGQGVTSIYLHLSRIKVQPGQFVQAGQPIGTLGSTGAATGPHLHWGLYVHGQSIDPVPWRETGFE